jgi:hypothetical protein
VADQTGADPAVRSLEPNDPDMGVNRRQDPEAQAVDGSTAAPATTTGPATDEEPTPAEEMDDVGTHDEKANAEEAVKATAPKAVGTGVEAGTGTGTTTRTARAKTAAEIVAEQRARERSAAEASAGGGPAAPAATGAAPASVGTAGGATVSAAGSEDAALRAGMDSARQDKGAVGNDPETSVTKPVGRVPANASGNNRQDGKSGSSSGKGKQALRSVDSGVRKLRNLIASLIWLAAVLAAAVLALGALFTALDQTNQSNEIVRWVLERGHDLVGPFKDLFRLETAKNTLLVNWGIAALVYLIAGKIIERFVRP